MHFSESGRLAVSHCDDMVKVWTAVKADELWAEDWYLTRATDPQTNALLDQNPILVGGLNSKPQICQDANDTGRASLLISANNAIGVYDLETKKPIGIYPTSRSNPFCTVENMIATTSPANHGIVVYDTRGTPSTPAFQFAFPSHPIRFVKDFYKDEMAIGLEHGRLAWLDIRSASRVSYSEWMWQHAVINPAGGLVTARLGIRDVSPSFFNRSSFAKRFSGIPPYRHQYSSERFGSGLIRSTERLFTQSLVFDFQS